MNERTSKKGKKSNNKKKKKIKTERNKRGKGERKDTDGGEKKIREKEWLNEEENGKKIEEVIKMIL